jgi:uncharacterized membrane protein
MSPYAVYIYIYISINETVIYICGNLFIYLITKQKQIDSSRYE